VGTEKKHSIAYYVSAHGYGHGVRSCSIIRALNALYPQVTVHVVSNLPSTFLSGQLGAIQNSFRAERFDIGMVQIDSIRLDVDATLAKIEQLYCRRRERVAGEEAFLKEKGIGLIVVDIPALPLEAAALLGIPRLAIGNFGWDWIYSGFLQRDSRWKPIVDAFREGYAKTDLLLRLPFCERMDAFPHIEDIPLVASPGRSRRAQIAGLTGCDPGKKWILLSFTTLDWSDDALARVQGIKDYRFFTVSPLVWKQGNIHPLDREQVTFSDVIASVDAVISKPGFGILSDCIVNQKPLIYADRSDFLEYPILVTAIRKYLKHVHIPAAKLYRGDLRESLDRIWESPGPEARLPQGGDRIAARRIARFAGLA
jgi:L-arabinokinase